MKDVVKITVPGKAEYLQMVRMSIATLAAASGFDIEKGDDISVSVVEACKIVTCHQYEGTSEFFDIVAEKTDGKMLVSVIDSCRSHDASKKLCCHGCPNEGDLALDVIKSLMDDVSVDLDENGNRVVHMEKRI